MSNWNLVWLEPKRTTTPDSGFSTRGTSTAEKPLTLEEEKRLQQLRRPTTSSQAKSDRPWMKRYFVIDYSDKGKHSWSKMELFLDCHKCMYKDDGTVKNGTKI